MVIVMGIGLIGSFVAMILRQKLVLVDPDEYSEHHILIPCAEPGINKARAVRDFRKARRIGETIAIPYRLEQLGETFWRWATENHAIVVDATDGNRASYLLSKMTAGHLSVVQAKVGGNTCFVRAFPADAGIGYCCMGFARVDSTPETSCIRIPVNSQEPASTQASLSAASVVAGLIAGSLESVSSEADARETRLDLEQMRLMSSQIRPGGPCGHRHGPESSMVVRLDGSSFDLSLADLAQEATKRLGAEVKWKSAMAAINSLKCEDCGHKLSKDSQWLFVGGKQYKCPSCGSANMYTASANVRPTRQFTAKDMMQQTISLLESGLPFSETYILHGAGGQVIELEVNDGQHLTGEDIHNG